MKLLEWKARLLITDGLDAQRAEAKAALAKLKGCQQALATALRLVDANKLRIIKLKAEYEAKDRWLAERDGRLTVLKPHLPKDQKPITAEALEKKQRVKKILQWAATLSEEEKKKLFEKLSN